MLVHKLASEHLNKGPKLSEQQLMEQWAHDELERDTQVISYLKANGYRATPKEILDVLDYMKSHGLADPSKMGPLMDDDDKLTGYLKAHGYTEVTQAMIDQLRGYMSAHGLRHIAELPK